MSLSLESLTKNLKDEVIPLTTVDMLASSVNMPYIFFYENSSNDADFMENSVLKNALYKTLEQFPILLGHLKAGENGHLDVVIGRHHINVLIYREAGSEHTHYTHLANAKFHRNLWPNELVPVKSTVRLDPHTGDIKLLHISIVRLKSNSGLAMCVSIPHYLMDGDGYFHFVNRWAEEAKAIVNGTCAPLKQFVFDRAVVQKYFPQEPRPALPALINMAYNTPSRLGEYVACMTPVRRARMLRLIGGRNKQRGCVFQLTRDKLDYLHQLVRPHLPTGMRATDNDVITALLAMVVGHATLGDQKQVNRLKQASDNPKKGSKLGDQFLAIPCDFRFRIGMTDILYNDNAQYLLCFTNPLEHLLKPITGESLAEVAIKARQTVRGVSAGNVAAFVEAVNSQPHCYSRPMTSMKPFKQIVFSTNHVRFKIYESDFGYGIPDFGIMLPEFSVGTNFIVPSKPPSRDLYLHLTNRPKVMDRILKNEVWMSLVSQMY